MMENTISTSHTVLCLIIHNFSTEFCLLQVIWLCIWSSVTCSFVVVFIEATLWQESWSACTRSAQRNVSLAAQTAQFNGGRLVSQPTYTIYILFNVGRGDESYHWPPLLVIQIVLFAQSFLL